MKVLRLTLILALVATMFTQCKDDMSNEDFANNDLKKAELPDAVPHGTFTVKVENVSTVYDYFAAGAQYIPDGESSGGPAFPGQSFTVKFHAGMGQKLSFATMYGASNDLFYAPSDGGISLFSGSTALTGDITGMISLWDAGTEVNHAPASGEDGADESVAIMSVRNTDNVLDGYTYNTVEQNLQAMLDFDGKDMFTLTIHVLPGSSTPLSPVAWVVHYDGQKPIFTEGALDYGMGLENLAETGNAGPLSSYLKMHSGYVSPIAPGVWVVHQQGDKPIFKEDKPEYGNGLEALAEVGDPSGVYNSLMAQEYNTGVYNTPDGAGGPAPIFPGESYTFTVSAKVGEYLSFASMLGKSNDLFFAPGDMGIRLFKGTTPLAGDVTSQVMLYDAGTEVNEYPGLQTSADVAEWENVMKVNDGYMWPNAAQVIKVTIWAN